MSGKPLYETCPVCDGAGRYKAAREWRRCKSCTSKYVVPVGVSTGQLERMVRKELKEQEELCGKSNSVGVQAASQSIGTGAVQP